MRLGTSTGTGCTSKGMLASFLACPTWGGLPGSTLASAPKVAHDRVDGRIDFDFAVGSLRSDRLEAADRYDARRAIVKFVGVVAFLAQGLGEQVALLAASSR